MRGYVSHAAACTKRRPGEKVVQKKVFHYSTNTIHKKYPSKKLRIIAIIVVTIPTWRLPAHGQCVRYIYLH